MSHIKRGGGLPSTVWRASGQWEILKQKYKYVGLRLAGFVSNTFDESQKPIDYFPFLFNEISEIVNKTELKDKPAGTFAASRSTIWSQTETY